MRLSYSSISTYQNCPLSYKFRYVDRLPTKRTAPLCFGSSLHAILAYFYDSSSAKPQALDELLEFLPQVWESDGYADHSEEQTYLQRAKEVLTQFYHTNIDDFQIPLALEHKFSINLDCCTLTGIIDRVDKLPNGCLEIIDYKTSKRLPPKSKIHSDLQLSIYHMAGLELWGAEPEKLSFYFLIPNTKISTKRNQNDINKTKSEIATVCEDMESKIFEAKQNPLCPWCDFQDRCPVHSGESMIRHNNLSDQQEPQIEDAVSEFFATKKKLEDYRTRLHELEKIIHSHCEQQNIGCLNSPAGEILRSKRVTQSYDVSKLRNILGPQGLWEEISTVDIERLRTLINSNDVDPNLKEQIKSALEAEELSHILSIKKSNSKNR